MNLKLSLLQFTYCHVVHGALQIHSRTSRATDFFLIFNFVDLRYFVPGLASSQYFAKGHEQLLSHTVRKLRAISSRVTSMKCWKSLRQYRIKLWRNVLLKFTWIQLRLQILTSEITNRVTHPRNDTSTLDSRCTNIRTWNISKDSEHEPNLSQTMQIAPILENPPFRFIWIESNAFFNIEPRNSKF